MKKILHRGAEAILYEENGNLVKERIIKSYRIKEVDDKIRKLRTRSEAKLLEKSSKIINVPKVFDSSDKEMKIEMELIKGKLLKDTFDNLGSKDRIKICEDLGKQIKVMHDRGIIHGDLTTSNMILSDDKLYFVDFGLGFISDKVEHKAVDLHLLKQALETKHHQHFEEGFDAIMKAYNPDKEFINRFTKVESRGRYKKKGF